MCESHLREGLAQIVWTGDCVCVLERKRTDMLNCDVVDSSLSLTKFIDTKITRAQVARISSSRWRVLAQFGFGSKEDGPRMTENLPFNSSAKAIRAYNHRAAQRGRTRLSIGKGDETSGQLPSNATRDSARLLSLRFSLQCLHAHLFSLLANRETALFSTFWRIHCALPQLDRHIKYIVVT